MLQNSKGLHRDSAPEAGHKLHASFYFLPWYIYGPNIRAAYTKVRFFSELFPAQGSIFKAASTRVTQWSMDLAVFEIEEVHQVLHSFLLDKRCKIQLFVFSFRVQHAGDPLTPKNITNVTTSWTSWGFLSHSLEYMLLTAISSMLAPFAPQNNLHRFFWSVEVQVIAISLDIGRGQKS